MLDERLAFVSVFLLAWGAWSYIQDMKHSADPNLVTWFLWSLAPMIAFAAQIQAGVGSAAILTLMVGLCPLAVFIAGLRKGTFRPSRFDLVCGSTSLIALVLWQITGSGTVAVALSILADSLAALPTLKKAYRDPKSESSFLFALFAISAGITLLTLTSFTLETAGFSLYILTLYVTLYVFVRFEPGIKAQIVEEREQL